MILQVVNSLLLQTSLSLLELLVNNLVTGKNNRFPLLDILRYLKNTHKNPKFGKARQVPTREFPNKFPDWDLSHSFKFGIFVGSSFNTLKYPKTGICYFFPVSITTYHTSFWSHHAFRVFLFRCNRQEEITK